MINKIIFRLKNFNNIKFRFDFPKSKEIILFDENHSSTLREIIKKDFDILRTREKEIYFWIFLKQIIFFDFKFLTYCKNYIKFVSPKVVISFIDSNMQFYKLKKNFKNIKFISLQNAHRLDSYSMFLNKDYFKLKRLNCDHIFVFNKYYIKEYGRIINSNYHVHGNFKNNILKINKTSIKNQFLFISGYRLNHQRKDFQIKLLNLISLYLSKSRKKLHILCRCRDPIEEKAEIQFYNKILKSNCTFKTTYNWKKSYEFMDKFENIIFMNSTLGYEAIARKKKVAIFSPGKKNMFKLSFGWPGPPKIKYNFFSAKTLSYNEIKRVLDNLYNCKQSHWEEKYFKYISDLMYFDKNNLQFRSVLNNILKESV